MRKFLIIDFFAVFMLKITVFHAKIIERSEEKRNIYEVSDLSAFLGFISN